MRYTSAICWDMARKALQLVEGKDRVAFDQDETLRLALVHLIQVIGEAARGISHEIRKANPHIPWKLIIGMRNRIVHDYTVFDDDVVWDTVSNELEPLVAALERFTPLEESF